jgi:hypothetical protein
MQFDSTNSAAERAIPKVAQPENEFHFGKP